MVKLFSSFKKGPVAQWIKHLTTNQGIPGSSPGGVAFFLFLNASIDRRILIIATTKQNEL